MPSVGVVLDTTKNVLARAARRFGKGFVDIVLGDGLYLTANHIFQCKEDAGSEVLIKTENESLDIIKDAKGLFFGGEGNTIFSLI